MVDRQALSDRRLAFFSGDCRSPDTTLNLRRSNTNKSGNRRMSNVCCSSVGDLPSPEKNAKRQERDKRERKEEDREEGKALSAGLPITQLSPFGLSSTKGLSPSIGSLMSDVECQLELNENRCMLS
ncbi:hypothetical protein MRB53_035565 [Persea americana]|uniref:Uncharacterized protein n=1 Tax=Persea americana TaxID=3435 RepID=A0ACC2K4Z4_PERAE|nr:hypothetical protein MRB53_035565 [Persea americana]